MSHQNQKRRSTGRTIAAFSILIVGLTVSARLIFGGPMFRSDSDGNADTVVDTTTLTSLEPRQDSSPVTASQRPIESIRVGDRVLAANPEVSEEERSTWQDPDWANWLHLTLKMPLPTPAGESDPPILNIEILRPEQWLIENFGLVLTVTEGGVDGDPSADDGRALQGILVDRSPLRECFRYIDHLTDVATTEGMDVVGLTVDLELPEMGAVGTAFIMDVQACPVIEPSDGQVVTATFSHPPTTQVLNVQFEGDRDTIGVTDNHLFWSADRHEFIAIGKMDVGERVTTYHGETKRIESRLPRPGPQLVYNLEVYGEHVYYVGEQGLLVHNAYAMNREAMARYRGLRQKGFDKVAARQMVSAEFIPSKMPWAKGQKIHNFSTIARGSKVANNHGHHIVFKAGRAGKQREILAESKAILEDVGINWYADRINLVNAPNAGHSTANASRVLARLQQARGNRAAVESALRELGEAFRNGSISNLPRAPGF